MALVPLEIHSEASLNSFCYQQSQAVKQSVLWVCIYADGKFACTDGQLLVFPVPSTCGWIRGLTPGTVAAEKCRLAVTDVWQYLVLSSDWGAPLRAHVFLGGFLACFSICSLSSLPWLWALGEKSAPPLC